MVVIIAGMIYFESDEEHDASLIATLVCLAFATLQGAIAVFNSGGHCCFPTIIHEERGGDAGGRRPSTKKKKRKGGSKLETARV